MAVSASYSQATAVSAPSAVLAIACRCRAPWSGRGVMPQSTSFSNAQPSAVRKKAPVLYRLRMLSSTTTTGRLREADMNVEHTHAQLALVLAARAGRLRRHERRLHVQIDVHRGGRTQPARRQRHAFDAAGARHDPNRGEQVGPGSQLHGLW